MISPLQNWIPYKIIHEQDQTLCRWLNTGDKPFIEPFFDDTIHRCKSTGNYHIHSVSNIELLPDWAASLSSVPPTAFIFHISRCGSTLVSQLLGLNPQHIVLAEVPALDQVLRSPYKQLHKPDVATALQAAIRFYGQRRTGHEQRLFIKTDSWHVCFYQLLRQLYPEVPFIFLYRKPAEVIRSHQKLRGMQAVPGVVEPEVFGFTKEPVTDLDAYMAKVMERYFTLFLEIIQNDRNALLVNYHEGMMPIMEKIAAATGMQFSQEEKEQMTARAGYHAKYPEQVFDETGMQDEVPPYLQSCAALYNQLEHLRLH
jgi:hypothetical protein